MDANALSKADYLDILFDNRNKQYGSYELRKNYDKRVKKALLYIMSLCFVLSVYILWHKENDTIDLSPLVSRPFGDCTITTIDFERKKLPVIETVKPTVANAIPKIVDDNKVIEPPATVDDLKGKESGPVNAVGSETGSGPATSTNSGSGNSNITATTTNNEIVTWTEQMPEFQGNLAAYLQKNLRYPDFAKENNIEGRVIIQFVVNEDGSIGNAIIKKGIGGGCNEEALRVVNTMPNWKPGMQNGKHVKVYYTLPITFMLE